MRDVELFQMALALASPWYVDRREFDAEARRPDLYVDFRRGGRFTCAECGVKLIPVPWARPGSGFTVLFEAMLMAFMTAMPVAAVARLVGEHDSRLWRVLHHHVDVAREEVSHAAVRRVGVDETSLRRGHEYVSLFVDLDVARVLFATEGRESRPSLPSARISRSTAAARTGSAGSAWTCHPCTGRARASICPTPRSPSIASPCSSRSTSRSTRCDAPSGRTRPSSRAPATSGSRIRAIRVGVSSGSPSTFCSPAST